MTSTEPHEPDDTSRGTEDVEHTETAYNPEIIEENVSDEPVPTGTSSTAPPYDRERDEETDRP